MSFIMLWICKEGGLHREFTYGSRDLDLEGVYTFLTRLVAMGWQVEFVEYQDKDGSCIKLPVAAFDGQSFSKQVDKLQAEWEAILTQHFKE